MHLAAELLMVPTIMLLVSMRSVSKNDQDQARVAQVCDFLLGTLLFCIISFSVMKAIGDYPDWGTLDTLRNIALTPIMSLSTIPFFYGFTCCVLYDTIFTRLSLGREKAPVLVRYLRRRIFSHCGLSLRRLYHLANHPLELMRLESKEDLESLLKLRDLGTENEPNRL